MDSKDKRIEKLNADLMKELMRNYMAISKIIGRLEYLYQKESITSDQYQKMKKIIDDTDIDVDLTYINEILKNQKVIRDNFIEIANEYSKYIPNTFYGEPCNVDLEKQFI